MLAAVSRALVLAFQIECELFEDRDHFSELSLCALNKIREVIQKLVYLAYKPEASKTEILLEEFLL